jgi:hypothetical protein
LAVRPLKAHQLLVLTEKRRWFHNPNDLAQRFDRAPCSRFQFDPQHNPIKSAAILQVTGGKVVYAGTVNP